MSFFVVNGISVPLEIECGTRTAPEGANETIQRSFSGGLLISRRHDKRRVITATTTVLTADEARLYRHLLEGDGQRVSFDSDMVSSRGLAPTSGSNYSRSNTGGVDNKGKATVIADGFVRYRAELEPEGPFTVLAHWTVDAVWTGFARTSEPLYYEDGETGNGTTINAILKIDDEGRVRFEAGEANRDVDELVWLPYEAPAEWLEVWTTSGFLFPELPYVRVEGDILRGGRSFYGLVTSVEESSAPFQDGGEWHEDGVRLSFTLIEAELVPVVPVEVPDPPVFAQLRRWHDAWNLDGSDNETLEPDDVLVQWNGRGSLSEAATQASSGNRARYRADLGPGGGPCVEFDGNDSYVTATTAINQPLTIAMVLNSISGTRFIDAAATADCLIGESSGQWLMRGPTNLAGGTLTRGKWDVVVARFNGASSELSVNGTVVASGEAGASALNGIRIGGNRGNSLFVTGYIAEVLVYEGVGAPSNAQLVEYFKAKHKVSSFPV